MLVCESDSVDALPVVGDDRMGLQTEDDGLRDGAEDGQGPAQGQQDGGPPPRGPVRDREHDGAEPVHRDGHQDVAGEEVSEDPETDHDLAGEPVGPPGHGAHPGDLQRDPDEDDLSVAKI